MASPHASVLRVASWQLAGMRMANANNHSYSSRTSGRRATGPTGSQHEYLDHAPARKPAATVIPRRRALQPHSAADGHQHVGAGARAADGEQNRLSPDV